LPIYASRLFGAIALLIIIFYMGAHFDLGPLLRSIPSIP